MITVVHVFHAVPDKFASTFMAFADTELHGYRHEFIGMRQGTDHAHAAGGEAILAPHGWVARLRFFRHLLHRKQPSVWVFHGMFHGSEVLSLWLALFASTDLAWRGVWIIWGGDLYEFQQRVTSLKARIRRRLHGNVLARFNYIAGTIPGDLELAHLRYNPRAIPLRSLYINPLPYTDDTPPTRPAKSTVLLGNSADPTNEHLQALDSLVAIGGTFDIVCPLSYGGPADYVEKVIEKGRRLFGERFRPLTEMLSAEAYGQVIESVSHALFFHNRQQGLGNVLSLLCAGKQVYMREDTTGFRYFFDLGLDVRSMGALDPAVLSVPATPDIDHVTRQRLLIRQHFGHAQAATWWTSLFDHIAAQAPKYG